MAASDYRNGILTLLILGIGVKVLAIVGKTYISNAGNVPGLGLTDIVNSLDSITTLFLIGIGILILILLPLYLSKRSKEKKMKAASQPAPQVR